MTPAQLVLLGLVALLVFWALGAYNRLMTLRNAIGDAFEAVDEALLRRAAVLGSLLAGLRERLPDAHETVDALLAAQGQLLAAANSLRPHPARAARAAAVADAESAFAAQLDALLERLRRDASMCDDAALKPHQAEVDEAAQRLDFARQVFNAAVRHYNEAARQLPTRLLVRLFGIGAAGWL